MWTYTIFDVCFIQQCACIMYAYLFMLKKGNPSRSLFSVPFMHNALADSVIVSMLLIQENDL